MVQFMNDSMFTAEDNAFPPKELGFGFLEWDHLLSKLKLTPTEKQELIEHFVSSSSRSTQDTPRDDRSNYPGHWGAITEGPTHGFDEAGEEFQKATGVNPDGLSGVPELYGDYGFDYSGDDSFFQGWSDEALEFNKNCPEMKTEAAEAQKIVRPLNVSEAPGFEGVEEVIPSFSVGNPYFTKNISQVTGKNLAIFEFLQKLKDSQDLKDRDWWLSEISEVSAETAEHSGFTRKFLRYGGKDLHVPIFSFLDTLPIPTRDKYKEALVDFSEARAELEEIQNLVSVEELLQKIANSGHNYTVALSKLSDGKWEQKHKKWKFNNREQLNKLQESLGKYTIQRMAEMSYDEYTVALYVPILEHGRNELRKNYKRIRNKKIELMGKKEGVNFLDLTKEEQSNSLEFLKTLEEEAKSNMFMKRGLCVSYYTGTIGVYQKDRKEVQIGGTTVYEGVVNNGFKAQEIMFFSGGKSHLSRLGWDQKFDEFFFKTEEENIERFKPNESWEAGKEEESKGFRSFVQESDNLKKETSRWNGQRKFNEHMFKQAYAEKPLVDAHRWVLHAVFGWKNDTALAKVTDAIVLLGEHPKVKKYEELQEMMLKTHMMSMRFSNAVETYRELKEKADVKRSILWELNGCLYSDDKSNETRKHELQSYYRGLHHEGFGTSEGYHAEVSEKALRRRKKMKRTAGWSVSMADYFVDNKDADTPDPLTKQQKDMDWVNATFTDENKKYQNAGFLVSQYNFIKWKCERNDIPCPFTSANDLHQEMQKFLQKEFGNYMQAVDGVEYEVSFLDFNLKTKLFLDPIKQEIENLIEAKKGEKLKVFNELKLEDFMEEDLDHYDELYSKEDMEFLETRDEDYESEREQVLELMLTMK